VGRTLEGGRDRTRRRVQRVLRSEVLGPISEIAGRREARILLQSRLASLNSGQRRAQATMPFVVFVAEHFESAVLPTLKYATQEIYSFLLRKHLLPRFRDCRCVTSRARRFSSIWSETERRLWHGRQLTTSASLYKQSYGTAVSWNYISDNPVHGVRMPERSLKRPHRFLSLGEVRQLITAVG